MDEERIDELYALAPEGFTAARTGLSKELKAAGDREGAARVQSLKKPTVAAWAVNQLARQRQSDVDELLSLAEELRDAQKKALSGGGAKPLQEASARRRALVDRLAQAAAGMLEAGGYAPTRAHLDEVANTLLATTTDSQAAEAVRRGRLAKELPPPAGFGDLGGLAEVIPMPSRPKPPPEPSGGKGKPATVQSAAAARARKRAEELAREAQAVQASAAELSDEADRLESEALRIRGEAETADRAAARARREADRAGQRAMAARDRAEKAMSRLED